MTATLDRRDALTKVLPMAYAASEAILAVYATGTVEVEYKGKDDPVTIADKKANAILCAALERAFPGLPIVAEESDPGTFAGWAGAPAVWFVDPLDGTREFIARNGEFAVMIGLAEHGRATLGVIVCPALERSFVGALGVGAFEVAKDGTETPIHVSGVARRARARLAREARRPSQGGAVRQRGGEGHPHRRGRGRHLLTARPRRKALGLVRAGGHRRRRRGRSDRRAGQRLRVRVGEALERPRVHRDQRQAARGGHRVDPASLALRASVQRPRHRASSRFLPGSAPISRPS
jgi:fructose-1,6-bisphosphatase/inositol monophosphatase family enzyme